MGIETDFLIVIEIVSILIAVLTSLIVALFYIDKNRTLKKGQEILRSHLEIQEQGFENIYKEIHDNIGQVLSLAKLNLHTVETSLPAPANETVRCTKELVGQAITDLRSLSRTLNPEFITRIGLNEAVKRELLMIDKGGHHTNLSQRGHPFRLDKQKELIIFRIFQEHLNNIVTYSKASTVNVELEYLPKHLSLAISDDGQGLDDIHQQPAEGRIRAGIKTMQLRAALIGAALQFSSLIGGGTKIFLELPLK